ncbi:zinc finger protein 567-like [Bufo gargarizans]|uniref:zinc finger protein 567-like n=1 Tax=Bufo gargarizans TaxID=30331 RepID=UPI001CF1E068|nr:zinc finger protein 567-like [Bufo gargarizans]
MDRWVLTTILGLPHRVSEFAAPLTFPPPSSPLRSRPTLHRQGTVGPLLKRGDRTGSRPTLSNIFLVQKKGGQMQPVINLRPLNRFVRYRHFKMDGIHLLRDLLLRGDWMVKLDLKDAYLTVPVAESSRDLLRFRWKWEIGRFTCLPFGLSSALWCFTKLLRPAMAWLRKELCRTLSMSQLSLRQLAWIISLLSSSIQAVFPAPLHYRALQRLKTAHLHSKTSYADLISLEAETRDKLTWWIHNLIVERLHVRVTRAQTEKFSILLRGVQRIFFRRLPRGALLKSSRRKKTVSRESARNKRKARKVKRKSASKTARSKSNRANEEAEKQKPLKCNFCEKRFNSQSILEAHHRIHTGKLPYPCPLCDESFAKASLLAAHSSKHKERKPYQCDQCDKNFNDQTLFLTHKKTHEEETPHECSECSSAFPSHSSLLAHEQSHLKPKPYKCRHCEKSFNAESLLATHEGVHTGNRPYKCNQCSESYYLKSQLEAHQAAHSVDKPYPCSQCERSFNKKQTLLAHIRVHNLHNMLRLKTHRQ